MAAYGQSKQCAELYCGWFGRLLRAARPSRCATATSTARARTRSGEAGVIAIFAGRLLDGRAPVVFGDGTQTRDYTYVGDIVAANLAAAAHPTAHGAYNVGTGVESSRARRARRAARGRRPSHRTRSQPQFEPARLGELQRSSLDVTRARDELGFTAQTPLVEGMRVTLEALR